MFTSIDFNCFKSIYWFNLELGRVEHVLIHTLGFDVGTYSFYCNPFSVRTHLFPYAQKWSDKLLHNLLRQTLDLCFVPTLSFRNRSSRVCVEITAVVCFTEIKLTTLFKSHMLFVYVVYVIRSHLTLTGHCRTCEPK